MRNIRKNKISKAGPPILISKFRKEKKSTIMTVLTGALILTLRISLAIPGYSQDIQKPGTTPAIWHHRDIPFGDTVKIQGWNLESSTDYDVVVIWPDGSIVWGDGTDCMDGVESCWDTITTDVSGEFINVAYEYIAPEIEGEYQVLLYLSPWEGDLEQAPVAKTTFPNWDSN